MYIYTHVYIYVYCQRPLYQPDTEVLVSVQVRLKTRPWAGRPVFSPGGGRARARSAPAHKSLVNACKLEPKWSQVL